MNIVQLRRQSLLWAFMAADMVLAWLALAMASLQVAEPPSSGLAALVDGAVAHPLFTAVVLLAWHGVLMYRGLYASRRLEDPLREALVVLGCAAVLTGLVAMIVIVWLPRFAQASFITSFWALLSLLAVLERALLRRLLRQLHDLGRNLRFALVVGTGERAQRLARTLRLRPELGYRLIGCLDDVEPADAALLPWLGRLDDLPRVLSGSVVDEVFIALPMRSSHDRIQQAVLSCEEQGTLVTMPIDFFSARLARTRLGDVGQLPVLYLSAVPENDWRLAAKRSIDFVGSLAALVLLAPLMLAVAAAVRLNMSGPALFRQTRIGLNKRPFMMYKFRTMILDAEARQASVEALNEVAGPVFKIREDPRVTPLGRFLRRSSLDELPQLFNVLKGDMSLVGPRPLPRRDVDGFCHDWQRRRFSVLPGITCLWQLSGRSDVSFEQWMALDLEYIDRWSLRLDFDILIRTVRVVLMREGAY